MRRNKLLFMTPCVALATLSPIVSCGQKSDAELVVDAIFAPLDIKTPKSLPVANSFKDSLKTLSKEELNNELLYDLFALYNIDYRPKIEELHSWIEEVRYLYKNDTIAIKTNITKRSLLFDENDKLRATFLGYVSFVFTKDATLGELNYKTNDYFMITYDMFNLQVEINEDYCTLIYQDDPKWGNCIGFAKGRFNGGAEEHLFSIGAINIVPSIDDVTIPHNSKNWTKTA